MVHGYNRVTIQQFMRNSEEFRGIQLKKIGSINGRLQR